MDNPNIIAEGFSCEELAEALLVKLKPFIKESIREELAKMQGSIQPEKSSKKVTGFISDEPQISDTGRFTTREASKILNISRNTLNRYSNEGLIRCSIRKANGRKFYTGADIKKLWRSQY